MTIIRKAFEDQTDLEKAMDFAAQFNGRCDKPGTGIAIEHILNLINKYQAERVKLRVEGKDLSYVHKILLRGAELALEERLENPDKIPSYLQS